MSCKFNVSPYTCYETGRARPCDSCQRRQNADFEASEETE